MDTNSRSIGGIINESCSNQETREVVWEVMGLSMEQQNDTKQQNSQGWRKAENHEQQT